MFEKRDFRERIVSEMQKTILMDSELSFGKCYQDSSKVTEQIDDKNSIVQGANKLLDGSIIRLYDKYSSNLVIIIILIIIIIITATMIIIITRKISEYLLIHTSLNLYNNSE